MFAVLAVATAPLAAADAEDEFLDALASGGISIPRDRDEKVVAAGHGICREFETGGDYADAVDYVDGALVGNRSLANLFVSAATNAFCPKYSP